MKTSFAIATVASALAVSGGVIPKATSEFLVEFGPGQTRWVTEDEKWKLKKAGENFFDITEDIHRVQPGGSIARRIAFPTALQHQGAITPLLESLSTAHVQADLTHFAAYDNRHYQSSTGVASATWLFDRVSMAIGGSVATVRRVQHRFQQPSIVVTIPGQSEQIVVVGAHQDSIGGRSPGARAPGADDNGSGSMTILEALRALLKEEDFAQGRARNTVEFHWYAGEEAGLLGSLAIFNRYRAEGRDVVAMLNQDMTGYIQGTLDAGLPESFGLITDNVDAALTDFTRLVIQEYTDIGIVRSTCGYACSDHAAATRYGFPSAFVFESGMDYSNPHIHTASDTIDRLSVEHMVQHSRVVVGFAYELAFANL